MNLEARKLSLVQEFLRIDNENIIGALEKFLHKSKSDFFEQNLKPKSLQQFYQEIDQALEDEKNNNLVPAKDLKDKIQKWN